MTKISLNQKLTVIKNILMVKDHILQSENLLVFEKKMVQTWVAFYKEYGVYELTS